MNPFKWVVYFTLKIEKNILKKKKKIETKDTRNRRRKRKFKGVTIPLLSGEAVASLLMQ